MPSKFKEFLQRYKYFLFLAIVFLSIYHRWLSFSIFSSSDFIFQFSQSLRDLGGFGMWSPFGLGSINLLPWRLMGPGSLLFGFFGHLKFDSNIPDKILILWPWIILSGLSSFFLVKKIIKSNRGGLIGSLVFSLNTYFLAINTQGHIFLSVASVFAVLALLFFIKTLDEKKSYLIILTSLFLFITGSYDLRLLYISIFLIFFYTIFILVTDTESFEFKRILKTIFLASLPAGIVLLLNIYWVIPSFLIGSLTENEVLNKGLFGSGFFDLTKAITLFHPFWTGGAINWFVVQKIPFYFWLVPFLAFLGFVLNRKNRNILFFGFVSLLGILLSKQISQPFPHLYSWLLKNLPGFNAFREASKFYFLISLGYSVLIASFVDWLWVHWTKKSWEIYGKYFLTCLIICIFMWNAKPIITGEIGTMFTPRHIPKDYVILKNFMLKQPQYFRTFWTPAGSRWSFYSNDKPGISNTFISEWNSYFVFSSHNPSVEKSIMSIYDQSFTNNLFDISSIQYVIVPLQDKENEDDFFYSFGGEKNKDIRNWYIHQLDKVPWLKKIDIGTETLMVYENKDSKPHLYLTEMPETIFKTVSYQNVYWYSVSPTEYKISITNLNKKVFVNFSEKFHPGWRLRVGDFNWAKVLIDKNYFVDTRYHMENDAKLNSFEIDPDYIRQNFGRESYKENADGSLDVEMTLYFKAQSYFYLGAIISGVILVLSLGFLLIQYILWKKKKLL